MLNLCSINVASSIKDKIKRREKTKTNLPAQCVKLGFAIETVAILANAVETSKNAFVV